MEDRTPFRRMVNLILTKDHSPRGLWHSVLRKETERCDVLKHFLHVIRKQCMISLSYTTVSQSGSFSYSQANHPSNLEGDLLSFPKSPNI